jgi:hypothetical protein
VETGSSKGADMKILRATTKLVAANYAGIKTRAGRARGMLAIKRSKNVRSSK